jgi:hypothetical protein
MLRDTRLTSWFLGSSIVSLLAVAGCSGGGSGPVSSLAPKGTVATTAPGSALRQLTVKLVVPSSGQLPLLTTQARKDALRVKQRLDTSPQLGSIVFTGTLYPGYAGATPVVASSTLNTTSLPIGVSLGFNNVPAGNNEWVIVDAVGFDSANGTGSRYDLGAFAGLASTGSPPAFATLDGGSTLRLQLALEAMGYGILSTYDLQNETSLDTDLGNLIGNSGQSANSATGLFTNSQLTSLIATMYAQYNRTLTIQGSINAPEVASLVDDYRSSVEDDFVENVNSTEYALSPLDNPPVAAPYPVVYGAPTYYDNQDEEILAVVNRNRAALPPHTPGSGGGPGEGNGGLYYVAQEFDASGGSVTLLHVYGGALIVGMSAQPTTTSTPPPFYGGFVGLGGRAINDSTTETVPISTTDVGMSITDPQTVAMGYDPYSYDQLEELPANDIFEINCAYVTRCIDPTYNLAVTIVGNVENVTLDSWNPWALLSSSLEFCTGIDCFPVQNDGSYTARSPFFDSGADLAYYGWSAAGGAVTTVTQVGDGYQVAYSGGTSGYIGTTHSDVFFQGQQVEILSNFPNGTILYLNATCAPNGNIAATGIVKGSETEIYLTQAPAVVSCSSTSIGFSLPSGAPASGSYIIEQM